MLVPVGDPRIEQIDLLASLRVDADQIGAFMVIAFAARPGKRLRIIRHIIQVLFGNNVIDMEDKVRDADLRKMTILASLARAMLNELAGSDIHGYWP